MRIYANLFPHLFHPQNKVHLARESFMISDRPRSRSFTKFSNLFFFCLLDTDLSSGNRRTRSDDRSFPGINMQRVTRGVSSDSSMVECAHARAYSAGGPRENESEHARVRTVASARRMYIIYMYACVCMCMYVCVCAYVKILHNGILHNGLCPSRSWKEMKNEALLSAAPVPFRWHACVLACARMSFQRVIFYKHLFVFPSVQLFPYLPVYFGLVPLCDIQRARNAVKSTLTYLLSYYCLSIRH